MDMFKDFDHYNTPLGEDGTPYEYFLKLRDLAVEHDAQFGWSEHYGGFWVAAGYQAGVDILRNPDAFSARESTLPLFGSPTDRPLVIATEEEPNHSLHRNLVQGAFSPKSISLTTDSLRRTTNDLIDRFIEAGEVDIAGALTNEVPARALCLLMGLPPEYGDTYRTWTHAMSTLIHSDPETAGKHLDDMQKFFIEVLEQRRKNPGEDLLSALVQSEVNGKPLSELELLDYCFLFLLTSIHNTAKFLGSLFWHLAWDTSLRASLIARPELVPMAIEEALRFYSPAMTVRTVLKPISIGGIEMEPEQKVLQCHPIINRDPRQFSNPDLFRPERNDNRHLALGVGIHRCLGIHMLKNEARVTVEEFLRRVPEFALDDTRRPEWLVGQVGGMQTVPIVFTPGAPRHGN